ncbi:MAG: FAD-dependent oxidoreductase [Nitrospirota bacterium]
MPKYDYDMGVLGGGSAGLTVAAGTAQLGAKTILIDKAPALGGDCLHYGCVPSKTLIRTAQVYHRMKNARRYGLPETDLKPVDYRDVARRIQEVIAVIQKHDSAERFCKLGARVEFGEPRFVDEHAVRINGKTVSARYWAVCTGSSPALPPIRGLAEVPHVTNREIFSLDELPRRLIVVGGGPIGIEMAQAFSRLGSRVVVLQRRGQILAREDKDMADAVMAVLRSEGVEFHLNARVEEVRDLGAERELLFTLKGEKELRSVRGDILLVATGRVPNVQGLGLEEIGVSVSEKGVEVDDRLRSAQKHIYAAGDALGRHFFTHAAGYEGGIVVTNAVFRLPRKADYTLLPWCTFTEPELASVGMNEARAGAAGVRYSVWTSEFAGNDRSQTEGETTGRIKMLLDADEKPLGVQILGPRAGDLLGEWVGVLNGGVKLTKLAGAVHPYPTLGEINKKVAGDLLASKIFSDTVRKGLKLFFSLRGRACNGAAASRDV